MNVAKEDKLANSQNGKFSVLIVDDSEMNRDLLTRRLAKMDLQLSEAANGEEALEAVKKHSYDLVLLDIMMPVMDGYETLEHMQKNQDTQRIPVIMITALDDVDSAVRCIDMGAVDYITKPFNPTLLKSRVTACLERKRLSDDDESLRLQTELSNEYLSEQVREKVREISKSQLAAIFAMLGGIVIRG